MESVQRQMVFCCAEQWLAGSFYGTQPYGDGLRLSDGCTDGCYCTAAIDSGENGFAWGRIFVDSVLPPDTGLRVYAYAADSKRGPNPINPDGEACDNSEDPIPALREAFSSPVSDRGDAYLSCTGRYLWLMLELSAAGPERPEIRRLRIWMGGDHMTDYLPAIYRSHSHDFTYRFLSVFDSMLTDMDRQIDTLPGQMDYEYAGGDLLRYLASWVCVEEGGTDEEIRQRIASAPHDYGDRCTVAGVRRSIREMTGHDPILIEHFRVSPNRPDCADPVLYRRLYGEDPCRCFALLPEDTFHSQRRWDEFGQSMQDRLPAGMSMQIIRLKQCVQLGWHTYLGINSRLGGYVAATLDEQATIHYDTTIGGANHE